MAARLKVRGGWSSVQQGFGKVGILLEERVKQALGSQAG